MVWLWGIYYIQAERVASALVPQQCIETIKWPAAGQYLHKYSGFWNFNPAGYPDSGILGETLGYCFHRMALLILVPRPQEEGEKRPGTNCTHMRQHFQDIYRKFVPIPLMNHVVVPRKENTNEIYGGRELQAKRNTAADRYHRWNIQNSSYPSFR